MGSERFCQSPQLRDEAQPRVCSPPFLSVYAAALWPLGSLVWTLLLADVGSSRNCARQHGHLNRL